MKASQTGPAAHTAALLLAGLAGTLGLLPPRAVASVQADATEVVTAVSPAVVTVSVLFAKDPAAQRETADLSNAVRIVRPGSGVIVSKDGLIVTNAHLVAEAIADDGSPVSDHWILVSMWNGYQHLAEVVAQDERTDLALLRIQGGAQRLAPLPLGDPQRLAPGERVLAISFAGGAENNVFAGVLSFPGGPTRLRAGTLEEHEMLLSDARFHKSLDGGPLVDLGGRLLGVHNSSHVSESRGFFVEEEKDKEPKPDTDYAVIVSADAIRAVFAQWLPKDLPPSLVEVDDPRAAVHAIAAIAPSVVSVWTGAEEPHPTTPDPADPQAQRSAAGLGSGVVIDPAGLVLTSSALFPNDVERASVRLATGETYAAELVQRSTGSRAVLLRVALPEGITLPAATLADSRAALAGEQVAVVGRPFGQLKLSVGVLSALERQGFLQVASWVHRGHLGGALVDRYGRLLGIASDRPETVGRVEETSFLGFAVPLATLLERFADALEGSGVSAPSAYELAEIEARRTPAVQVVDRTHGALVNVIVSAAMPGESSGFNPFGESARIFLPGGQGSGVIIDPSGLALSNWHVVDAAVRPGQEQDHLVEVTLATGARYVATVLSTSRDDDLALLALQLAPGETLLTVELGDSDTLKVGQQVFAIGNPLGLANSVSAGIVSCKEIDVRIVGRLREYKGMLMTDAAINPGNSGGALLDAEARLIGINSAGRPGAGMAIPVNKAREVFSDKLLSAERMQSTSFGFRVEERGGALFVAAIEPDGPAGETQLQEGDQLLSIDGTALKSPIAFARTQREARPGEALELRIARHGEELELELKPVSYAAWRMYRQSGILLEELDYAAETALVHDASVDLHRSYTGDFSGQPAQLMSGALRVARVRSIVSGSDHPLRAGDLLLGVTTYVRGMTTESQHLTRLERLADLAPTFDARATKEGEWCECWILREGEIQSARFWIRRPPL